MGWADNYIEKLKKGEEVSFRPRGNSMTPKIKSGQLVTLSPDISDLKGNDKDVVLCQVGQKQYLHFVRSIRRHCGKEVSEYYNIYQIVNARGWCNGFTTKVYGKVIRIED